MSTLEMVLLGIVSFEAFVIVVVVIFGLHLLPRIWRPTDEEPGVAENGDQGGQGPDRVTVPHRNAG